MKLSDKQKNEINKIILHEVKSALQGRKDSVVLSKKAMLNEVSPNPERVDLSLVKSELERNLPYYDIADELITDFDKSVMKIIAKAVNQHAVSYDDVNAQSLWDDLDEVDDDVIMDVRMTCSAAIAEALETYANDLAEAAVSLVGGLNPEDHVTGKYDSSDDEEEPDTTQHPLAGRPWIIK